MTQAEREAAVDWFAEQMKAKLREPRNEAKGGWRDDPFQLLLMRLGDELVELEAECSECVVSNLGRLSKPLDFEAVIKEAADVANFCLMLADKARQELSPGPDTD